MPIKAHSPKPTPAVPSCRVSHTASLHIPILTFPWQAAEAQPEEREQLISPSPSLKTFSSWEFSNVDKHPFSCKANCCELRPWGQQGHLPEVTLQPKPSTERCCPCSSTAWEQSTPASLPSSAVREKAWSSAQGQRTQGEDRHIQPSAAGPLRSSPK